MLRLENVCYEVKDAGKKKTILKDINLELADGETVVVTGHNGSGKSSLMKIIMGIYPVTSGKIYFNDIDITNMSITDRANLGMAYAFQTPVRFKGLKVRDLITTAQKTNSVVMEVCNYLSKVGLCARDYIDRDLDDKLSGGELKRIEIAITLARGAKLNIFDEPEAGIDLWSFGGLIAAFDENKKQYGGTNIIISHQEKILEIADKILVMNGAKIERFGSREEIMPTLNTYGRQCSKLQGECYE
ncbi:MAG: ATP-binding cassette domain-containing protein [Clostridiales bacterium]|nr:ATP-binding cassette domain-containing protein [Clostridiales bacterium]